MLFRSAGAECTRFRSGSAPADEVTDATAGDWPRCAAVRYIPYPSHAAGASPLTVRDAWRIRLVAYGARLESVLGASPRGFESPILRGIAPESSGFRGFSLFHRPWAPFASVSCAPFTWVSWAASLRSPGPFGSVFWG